MNTFRLNLKVVNISTYQMEIFTPRNLDVALAMVEGHAVTHGRGYSYSIENPADPSFERIYLANE